MEKYIWFSLIVLFCSSCFSTKKNCYSYTVDIYSIDTIQAKTHLSSGKYISCDKYLFEFKIRIESNVHLYVDSIVRAPLEFDTIGIYLLSGEKKMYYEFDSFSLKSKLIDKGLFPDKSSGMKITPVIKKDSSDTYYGAPKEVTINGIQCYYADIISKVRNLKDTVEEQVTLLKIKRLNSIYSLIGVEFPDNEYCVIGINVQDPKTNEGFIQELKTLRQLTREERKICQRMIKASGL